MKNKLWLLQIPIIAIFASFFWISELAVRGDLHDPFLQKTLAPSLRTVSGWFTNMKFGARGSEAPKNKVVIVEIDSNSLDRIGRWPWHRDVIAKLIEKTYLAGARVVGLDIVFSEPDLRVSDELFAHLQKSGMAPHEIEAQFETDLALADTISFFPENLVLGWTSDTFCQPLYAGKSFCPVTDPDYQHGIPEDFAKYKFDHIQIEHEFNIAHSPLMMLYGVISNVSYYRQQAKHAGYFNAFQDPDGFIRKTPLAFFHGSTAYPSLALEMAKVYLNEELAIDIGADSKVKDIRFARSGRKIPVTPLGFMDINFRGPAYTFQYIPAFQLLESEADEIQVMTHDRRIASISKTEALKDAVVLIGVSALGVYDIRAFPFDSNTPGVEGHANILDNLLSGDMLTRGEGKTSPIILLLLMVFGALAFAYSTQRLESIPALLLFLFVMGGFTIFDLKVLFENDVNWDSGFFYLEITALFVFTLAVKYVLEERNKKFIKGAFSKYVAPAVVDSILKDPAKLAVGGEKRELSILFSDIRSFTSFSEKMDAKRLAQFLNEYLSEMTEIVFQSEGTLDKYIGDAVMAFWGAPLDQPKHAANACRAAIQMQQALLTLRPRLKEKYDVEVNIGIGINSGSVNVGNMGSDRIFEYTVIGDHVNLASRLEGLTKAYGAGILTTRFTFNCIEAAGEPLPPHRVLDFVKVKGKAQSVELIQVLERDLSAEGLKEFEDARRLYEHQRWDDAIAKFQKANELLRFSPEAEDGPSLMYIDRCKEFKLQPPNADWDGSWTMTSK